MTNQPSRPPSSCTVTCRCGTYHIVATAHFGLQQSCRKCATRYTVVWRKDPKTGRKAPMLVMSAKPKAARTGPPPEALVTLACGCGYKRKGSLDELPKGPSCPGCGQPMYLDRTRPRPKPPEKPAVPYVETSRYISMSRPPRFAPPTSSPFQAGGTQAPTATPPPIPNPVRAGETRITQAGKVLVLCPSCGDRMLVAAGRKLIRCIRCDVPLEVKAAAVPVEEPVFDLPPDAEALPEPPAKAPPAFLETPSLDCLCGAVLDVRGASPGSVYTCPACRRTVTMQKARHPQTLSTVMKPVFAEPPPPAEPEAVIDADAVDILCACGEALLLSPRDAGHPVQCPGCSVLMEVQQTPGGLKVKPLGRIDEQSWSLEDFS